MDETQSVPARTGANRLTWSGAGGGLFYVVCTIYSVSFVPAVAFGAIDEILKHSPLALVVAGVAMLVLLPPAWPGLVALWFSPSSASRPPDNALLPGLRWLGRATWAGILFVFAVVFGAVVGVTASGISDIGKRYATCLGHPGAADDCQSVISLVQRAGGVNGLYLNELERGTFFPVVTAAVSVAVLLLGIRYALATKRLIRREALGRAIVAAFDHGRALRPKIYTRQRAVTTIRFARRWSPFAVFLLGIASALFVDVYVRWLLIR